MEIDNQPDSDNNGSDDGLEFESEDAYKINKLKELSRNLHTSLESISHSFISPIEDKINKISFQQKQILEKISHLTFMYDKIKSENETLSLSSSNNITDEIKNNLQILSKYHKQLSILISSIQKINDRCASSQHRINKIRKNMDYSGRGFKEMGIFYYKCCYQGMINIII